MQDLPLDKLVATVREADRNWREGRLPGDDPAPSQEPRSSSELDIGTYTAPSPEKGLETAGDPTHLPLPVPSSSDFVPSGHDTLRLRLSTVLASGVRGSDEQVSHDPQEGPAAIDVTLRLSRGSNEPWPAMLVRFGE